MTGNLHVTRDEPTCLLMDNGSHNPDAILSLRKIARKLSKLTHREIRPISLLHSNQIDITQLGGYSAEIFESAINELVSQGKYNILIIPLFFGPSRSLTCYLAERISQLKNKYTKLKIRIAQCLVQTDDDKNYSMAKILMNGINRVIASKCLNYPSVILVDHGTPEIKVNEVRTFLAQQLGFLLKGKINILAEASMEKRKGCKYSFNGPLLLNQLRKNNFDQGDVIISLMFLLPGNHAGLHGDITKICVEAEKRKPKLRTHLTSLVGADGDLITLLKERVDKEFCAYK